MDFTVRLMDRYINICKDLKGPNILCKIASIQNYLNPANLRFFFGKLIQPNFAGRSFYFSDIFVFVVV